VSAAPHPSGAGYRRDVSAPLAARRPVLVVEDDDTIGPLLRDGLGAHGYDPDWARTGADAMRCLARRDYRLAVIDLGLPDLDGVDLVRRLRAERPDAVVLILTARHDDIDVIVGLDAGADDYLVKPVGLTVLLARIRAHLRRTPDGPRAQQPVEVGGLNVDPAARRCRIGGVDLALRAKEFDLLAALAAHPGVACSREDLMAQVWDENWFGPTKTLDVTMACLRRKLEAAAAAVNVSAPTITTLRGHGYRLEAPQEAAPPR
jgi:DNA-binding response OmpR family regulator